MAEQTKSRFSRLQVFAVLLILFGLFLAVIARLRINPANVSSLGFEKLGQALVPSQQGVTILGALCAVAAAATLLLSNRNARIAAAALVVGVLLAIMAVLTALAQGGSRGVLAL